MTDDAKLKELIAAILAPPTRTTSDERAYWGEFYWLLSRLYARDWRR